MAKIFMSNPSKVDLSVYKGDSGSFRITIIPDGVDPVNITDAVWDGDIRLEASDEEVITSFEIVPVIGDPTSIDVVLSAEKSKTLPPSCVYDIEMRMSEEVSTLIYGTIIVKQDVSRPAAVVGP